MKRKLARLAGSATARNAAWLSAVQLAGVLVPLMSVPWLTRALGVESWGRLLYVQSLAMWMAAIVEYGFGFSATRELSRVQEIRSERQRHSTAVFSAKVMLAIPCLIAYCIPLIFIPALRQDPSLAAAGLVLAIAQGLHPIWFFQSLERLKIVSSLDLASRFLSLALIVALVRHPSQAAWVLWIQAGLQLVSTGWATWAQFRLCGGIGLDFHLGFQALRQGAGLFLFRASVTLYTSANGFLLGSFSSPREVAFFGGAERIAKASLTLLMPISQAIYPRINALQDKSRQEANRLTFLMLAITQVLAWIGTGMLVLLAPWIVGVVLGSGFEAAIPVLRTVAFLLPVIAASNVFGIQFLLPRRMDGAFNGIIIVAGLLNCLFSMLVAPRYGAFGMGWAVLLAEVLVTVAMGVKVVSVLRNEAREGEHGMGSGRHGS